MALSSFRLFLHFPILVCLSGRDGKHYTRSLDFFARNWHEPRRNQANIGPKLRVFAGIK